MKNKNIVLFSNECSKCRILEHKLNEKKIVFTKESNLDEIIKQGFRSIPVLKVNDKYLDFLKAVENIKTL